MSGHELAVEVIMDSSGSYMVSLMDSLEDEDQIVPDLLTPHHSQLVSATAIFSSSAIGVGGGIGSGGGSISDNSICNNISGGISSGVGLSASSILASHTFHSATAEQQSGLPPASGQGSSSSTTNTLTSSNSSSHHQHIDHHQIIGFGAPVSQVNLILLLSI